MVGRRFFKIYFATLIAIVGIQVSSQLAHAQIDPASEMLIDTTGRQSSLDNGLDSGRYTVRPKSTSKKSVVTATPSPTPAASATPAPTATPTPAPMTTPTTTPTPAESSTSTEAAAPTSPSAATPVEATAVTPAETTPLLEASPTPKFDRRTQLLELSLSPVYIYNNSESSYWYRSYFTASPGAHINANVWLTDALGLHASFLTTLSASLKDSVDQSRVVETSQNWFDVGLRFRHFASSKPKSSALVLGVDWSEYRFNVSNSAMMRDRLTTTGAQFLGGVEIPTSKHYMWTADVSLIPKANHEELSTQSSVKSGTSNETNTFGASLGGVFRIDSTNAYFWRVSHKVEKNVFSGPASAPDPISGVTPNGVSVINSTTFLEIGCTWGN